MNTFTDSNSIYKQTTSALLWAELMPRSELINLTKCQKPSFHIGDSVICADSRLMPIPGDNDASVRQVVFDLPLLFQDRPVVTTTIYTNVGPGNPFAVWGVEINNNGAETQIVISAANVQPNVAVQNDYFCDIIVIGQPA